MGRASGSFGKLRAPAGFLVVLLWVAGWLAACDGGRAGVVVSAPDCADGKVACNGLCVDVKAHASHCGACGRACKAGEVCDGAGQCGTFCQVGLEVCGERCVDLDSDRLHCGGCDQSCPEGQVCDGQGACNTACQSDLTPCGDRCVDLSVDTLHCGACGQACPAGHVCDGEGQCALSCQEGLAICDGTCVDLDSSNDHCGQCGVECPSGERCDGSGICVLACPIGQIGCDGKCIDPLIDNLYCGASGDCLEPNKGTMCPKGHVCNGAGLCELSCQSGLIDCNGTCIDPLTSQAHCGATADCQGSNAGTACPGAHICEGGLCTLSCKSGFVACSGNCIDPLTDDQFCGASGDCLGLNAGLTCAGGQACTQGICCTPGEVNCGGQRVDLSTDLNHCGSCGTKCAANEQCSAGQCVSFPKPCDTGAFGVINGSNWVVCQADAQTAWVSANNSGTYEINKICIHLGYAKASQWGGTCGDVCGYCQGATSCNNVGNRTFDNSTGCNPPNTHYSTVHRECAQ